MALPSEVFSDSERAILEFLAKNGSAGRSTVEKTFGLPRTTANYQLKKLVDGKLIRKSVPARTPVMPHTAARTGNNC